MYLIESLELFKTKPKKNLMHFKINLKYNHRQIYVCILLKLLDLFFIFQSNILLDRKVLTDLAIYEPRTFQVNIYLIIYLIIEFILKFHCTIVTI